MKILAVVQKIAKNTWLVCGVFLVLGLILYGNALRGPLFWDAEYEIVDNVYIRDWSQIGKFFTQSLQSGSGRVGTYWRPVLLLLYALEWHIWGNWSIGFHTINLLVHVLNATLLCILLTRLFQHRLLSLFVATTFLVHPIQTESVTYITGIADPLMVLWMFLGLLVYGEKKHPLLIRYKPYVLSLLFFLALGTKETAIIFPAVLLGTSWIYKQSNHTRFSFVSFIRKEIKNTWYIYALLSIYGFLRITVLRFGNIFNLYDTPTYYTTHLSARIYTFAQTIPIYLKLLVWPHNLHMEWDIPIAQTIGKPAVVLGIAIILITLTIALALYRRVPLYLYGALLFFIPFLPVSGIFFPANALFYEHWTYLPLVGLFLAIGLGTSTIGTYLPPRIRAILFTTVVLAWFAKISIVTIQRNADYRDPVRFYQQTLSYNPDSLRVWNNLGMVYADQGDIPASINAYNQAITRDTDHILWPSHHNVARIYEQIGEYDKAIAEYQASIVISPDTALSYINLIQLYIRLERSEDAYDMVVQARKLFPDDAQLSQYMEILTRKGIHK